LLLSRETLEFLQRWAAVAFGGIGNVFLVQIHLEFDQNQVAYGVGG